MTAQTPASAPRHPRLAAERLRPRPDTRPGLARAAPRRALTRLAAHAAALGLVVAAGFVARLLGGDVGAAAPAMVFLMAVLLCGLAFGLWPALTAAVGSALAYNYFFLAPAFTLRIARPADFLTFATFFAVALATGWLTGRVRDHARAAAERASTIAEVLGATRRLSAAAGEVEAAEALAEQLAAATGGPSVVLTPRAGELALAAAAPPGATLGPGDRLAAQRAWESGAATRDGPHAPGKWSFRPLQGVRGRAGVVGLAPEPATAEASEPYVSALLDQGALALERAEFAAAAAEAGALRQSDRLRSALLNSVSHDLRTPLATVLGSVTTLIDYGRSLSPKVRADLLVSIREEAERLNRYVGDLLDMTRLEGGALVTRREWTDVRDVLRGAVERVRRRLGRRRIAWDFPPSLTLVMADAALLQQVLVNILENAIAYSPDEGCIEVAAFEDQRHVVISIEDEGPGVPAAFLERMFDKFRRLDEASDRGKGAGLGLAIAKGFVEAMGGRIAAVSPVRDGGGARILVSLPKAQVTPEFML